MAKLSDKTRIRILQLHALLGSDNEHESKLARLKLIELLSKHKLSWNDLPRILQTGTSNAFEVDDDEPATDADGPEANDTRALECVEYILQQYIDLQPHEYLAVALWILHTHVFDRFMVTPRLAITSPIRGCGKTTLLTLIEALSARAQRTDNISAAAVFHMIDAERCTLCVDEADNLGLAVNGLLRAAFNSGHRRGGKITRVIKGRPKRFSTFAPMAIAAIGILPLPTMARSVVIHMSRTDGTRRFRRLNGTEIDDSNSDLSVVYRQIFHWAKNVKLDPDPEMPPELRNRAADNWRPLLAIADSFGPASGKAAREAALEFQRGYHDEDVAVVLLFDIRVIFNATRAVSIASEQLVGFLNDMDDGGWSEWRGVHDDQQPRPLSQSQLAFILKPFGIRPRSIWPPHRKPGSKSRKGYTRESFEKAWAQYCSGDGTAAQQGKIRLLRRR